MARHPVQWIHRRLIWAAWILLLPACSEVVEEQPLSADAFCTQLPGVMCSFLENCFDFEPLEDCESLAPFRQVADTCLRAGTAASRGTLRYDSDQAAACLASHDQCAALLPLDFAVFTEEASACRGIFTGLIPLGGDCETATGLGVDECAEGYCHFQAGQCPGVCTPFSTLGEPCDEATHCDTTSYCGGGLCQPRSPVDTPCYADGQCQTGLTCVVGKDGSGEGDEPPGLCAILGTVGDPCAETEDCEFPLECRDDTCGHSILLGAPCVHSEDCPSGLACLAMPPGSFNWECWPLPSAGQPCDLAIPDESCAEGLVCFAPDYTTGFGECRSPGGLGEECTFATCQSGLWCRQPEPAPGVCAGIALEGESCELEMAALGINPCAAGLYCMGDGVCRPSAGLNAACSYHPQSCQTGLWCDASLTCKAPAGEGQPCTFAVSMDPCQSGLYCGCPGDPFCMGDGSGAPTEPTCLPTLESGSVCQSDDQCGPGFCDYRFGEPRCTAAGCASNLELVLPAPQP